MANYLIVGGSSGIGKALAEQLVKEGHRVFATYNTHPLTSNNSQLTYHPLNVLEENIQLSFLPESIDGIAYCPGAIQLKPFARIQPADFIADYNLQVVGAIKVIQAALPALKMQHRAL